MTHTNEVNRRNDASQANAPIHSIETERATAEHPTKARRGFGALRALALAAVLALLGNACATTATSAYSSDNGEPRWSAKDRTLAAALIAANVIDAGQTMTAVKSGLSEGNPIYGSSPNLGRMLATKAVVTGAVLYAANHFPGLRTKILTTNLAVQAGIIGLNTRYVGLKISF